MKIDLLLPNTLISCTILFLFLGEMSSSLKLMAISLSSFVFVFFFFFFCFFVFCFFVFLFFLFFCFFAFCFLFFVLFVFVLFFFSTKSQILRTSPSVTNGSDYYQDLKLWQSLFLEETSKPTQHINVYKQSDVSKKQKTKIKQKQKNKKKQKEYEQD